MRAFLWAGVILFTVVSWAHAGSLRVAPVLLDVPAPGATTMLTLRNDGDRPIHVQIRAFSWTGTQGEPVLEPTSNVVVSPPAATLTPGTEYVVRIIRLAKQPVGGEESYRILVDELPDTVGAGSNTVRFVLRYSIPVFFSVASAASANVTWSLQSKGNALILMASNSGGRRLRIANLKLVDGAGAIALQRPGLVGYVLRKSSAAWTFPAGAQIAGRGPLKLLAESESGAINAAVAVQTSR
ncbi:MAG: molecular chaperone [Pseudomonadota bacterium]